MKPFISNDWYWQVGSDVNRWFSSASASYVASLPNDAGLTKIASEQELWDVLDANNVQIPVGSAISSTRKDLKVSQIDIVALRGLFNHENRIRALEGKAAVTVAQFTNAVKALLPDR